MTAKTFQGRTFDRIVAKDTRVWSVRGALSVWKSKEDILLEAKIAALTARVEALESGVPVPTPTPLPTPPVRVPGLVLDQEAEGECVGYGWTSWAEYMGQSVPKIEKENPWAEAIYELAGIINGQWTENHPDEQAGTDVVAGAKAIKQLYVPSLTYQRAATMAEAQASIKAFGGVVIGVDWYDTMMNPDRDSVIHAVGNVVGGHCLFWVDYTPATNAAYPNVLQNSWGSGWGDGGFCRISDADLAALLVAQGDFIVPVLS